MIRIGCVPYLNAKPLLEGLEDVLLLPPADLVGKLVSGKLDVALLPAIEVLRRGLAHVRGIAIASPGKTDSVRLHHRVPVSEIRRVALDRNSRTSNMLTRILLEKRYGLNPSYVMRDPAKGFDFKAVDAVVTIGDTSFRPGKTAFLDLGSEWKSFTGKPFVYALWAHRPGHPKAREIARTLTAAKKRGTAIIPEIAAREAARLNLTPAYCRKYLTKAITFDLGPAERSALNLFGKYADDCP